MNVTGSMSYENGGRDKCSPKSYNTTTYSVDTSMQGAEMQDSPRGSSVNSSSSSLSPVRIDTSTPQSIAVSSSQFTANCPAPITGHQLLVDPITGQHYLVPSGPQAHTQLIYQPVYYTAAPAQPVFYQSFPSGAQGALLMPSLPSGQHNVGSFVHPNAISQRFSLTTSVMPSKPGSTGSSSPSIVDSNSGRFKSLSEERQRRRAYVEHEARSPPASPSYRETPLQLIKSLKVAHQQSNTGTNREGRRPSPLLTISANDVIDQVSLTEQRTPLYGASPAWWGDDKAETQAASENAMTDAEKANYTGAFRTVTKPILDTEPSTSRDSQNQRLLLASNAQKKKAIRMDIDFSKPFSDAEEKEQKAKIVSRAPPTSFTVPFDNEDTCVGKEKISLQDAAKRSTRRRFLRRSAPTAGTPESSNDANLVRSLAETDPKQYLFKKLLMGDVGSSEGFSGTSEFVASVGVSEKRDIDMISEAGTYVVDEKDRLVDPMASSQCINDSDFDSDSSETSTATTSSNGDRTLPSYAPINFTVNATTSEFKNDERRPEAFRRIGNGNKEKRETQKFYDAKLRKNLIATDQKGSTSSCVSTGVSRLCTNSGATGRTTRLTTSNAVNETNPSTPTKRNDPGLPASPRRCGTGSNSSPNDTLARTRSARNDASISRNDVSQIRRVDGGRYSMRTASSGRAVILAQNGSQAASRNMKPPFRVGPANGNLNVGKTLNSHKESAEMTAWLRRKDYNPMKAAAEARKLQQLKSRSDQYTANRSISFHQGTGSVQPKTSGSTLAKSRYNKSQDDLFEENSCGSRSVLAAYSKGVSENLNRLKLAEEKADSSLEASGVQKAVEQLALKCYRSIDLIRSTHHGRLPNAVENLLERSTESALKTENSVAEQVSRLSAAFDAIQKYLEVSSCVSPTPSSTNSGHASPIQPVENESSVL